jgi:uncharacterized membrane protein YfcA
MKIKKSVADGLFVGINMAIFSGIFFYFMFQSIGSSEVQTEFSKEIMQLQWVVPIMFGLGIGYYSGYFAYNISEKRQSETNNK